MLKIYVAISDDNKASGLVTVMTGQILNDEDIVTELDISHLALEDDTPGDNF